ncbi:phosphatase PAP2 family protein [Massilia sp. BJB1822]|uniref:phosphatase PAP2 family protein n=1 Tax=Massilia sp. BJB1822 TaxID=2744470 RepID=UPI001594756F|nr:phosphatase PAP2 family protein [Massilia sp. BJB1822]NVE01842.1 phosphatase PAP2 family protein [Massilia sp. BJB1822]
MPAAPVLESANASHSSRIAAAVLLNTALLILWLGNYTDIDLRLADAAYDAASRSFPMQHAWIAEKFNHVILKAALSMLGGAFVALCIWDWFRPSPRWDGSRRIALRVVAISAVLVPTVMSVLKHFSQSHCPWDLQRYGGTEPYIRLLEIFPAGLSAGHCMPAGHASSALWLVALSAFWWPRRPRMAAAVAGAMLLFGGMVGWMQQLRGAHFLTHTLWSAWIACAIVYFTYKFVKGLANPTPFGYSSVPAATQMQIAKR